MADIGRNYDSYLNAGANVAAIVIDAPERNAAMVQKLALPFPILSDPDGSSAIKPFEVWDGKGNMSKPATIALGPDGSEKYRYVGVDFVDRPVQDEARDAIATLQLDPIDATIQIAKYIEPKPGQRAASLEHLEAYMRGIRSSMSALSNRLLNEWDKAELVRTQEMAERYIAAVAESKRLASKIERESE